MTVLTFGTFDIIHPGHLDFFRQARKFGDRLVVCVARDETARRVKRHSPHHNEKKRQAAVAALPLVDEAVLGNERDYYKILETVQPDVIALGYDQRVFVDRLEEEMKRRGISASVVRLQPFHPEKYKSSKFRRE